MSAEQSIARTAKATWEAFSTRERFSLTSGSIAGLLLMYGLCKTMHVPLEFGMTGSLLGQPGWMAALLVGVITLVGGAVLASIFTAWIYYEGGLFCAGIALAGLSIRIGTMRYAIFHTGRASLFLTASVELLILAAGLFVSWMILRGMSQVGLLVAEVRLDPAEPDRSLDQKLLSTAAQVALMIVGMLLLCQTDTKAQTIASVGLSAFLGALGAHYFLPNRPSIWFWIAPIIVGLLGYLIQYFNPGDLSIGDVRGFFAPLARPIPLDYAGIGTAGSLLGYWTSQRWHHEMLTGDAADQPYRAGGTPPAGETGSKTI